MDYHEEAKRCWKEIERLKQRIRELEARPFGDFDTEELADELESRGYELTMRRSKKMPKTTRVKVRRRSIVTISGGCKSGRGFLPGETSIVGST